MQSYDNQPRQDDENSQVEHTNGLYIVHVCGIFVVVHDTFSDDYNILAWVCMW